MHACAAKAATGSTLPLTIMSLRVHLAVRAQLCCIGWQLVYWQRIIWLAVPLRCSAPSYVPIVCGLSA